MSNDFFLCYIRSFLPSGVSWDDYDSVPPSFSKDELPIQLADLVNALDCAYSAMKFARMQSEAKDNDFVCYIARPYWASRFQHLRKKVNSY